MPISGRRDLPLAIFNFPSRNNLQNKPNSAAPPVQSLRDSAAATPAGGAALRRRFRIFSFRYREMMSGMTMGGILSHPLPWSSSRSRNRPQSKHSSPRHITPCAAPDSPPGPLMMRRAGGARRSFRGEFGGGFGGYRRRWRARRRRVHYAHRGGRFGIPRG